ncbi:hypothetical protein [Staphylococcus shinii]|uniref:hypothetical protein n=1 Tax=Staphylococcus shinii TaxID=2912228 RepID=UPI0015E0F2C5|nr:hypothetical protein [Staphylococcus shinii]
MRKTNSTTFININIPMTYLHFLLRYYTLDHPKEVQNYIDFEESLTNKYDV